VTENYGVVETAINDILKIKDIYQFLKKATMKISSASDAVNWLLQRRTYAMLTAPQTSSGDCPYFLSKFARQINPATPGPDRFASRARRAQNMLPTKLSSSSGMLPQTPTGFGG
jgi:hypothetical protein